jgi:ferrous iron transport protein B
VIESFRQAPVPSCHSDAAGPAAGAGAPVVALVGAPNVGKTTLFNMLTGSRRETGNWPGTSVAVGHGSWQLPGGEVAVVDLPGTYSLDPLSPDEALTRTLLVEVPESERPDVTVVVLDATGLARSLYLLAQVHELPGRVVGVVTMTDIAAGRGVQVDVDRLAAAAKMPMVAMDPRRRTGVDDLGAVVATALSEPTLPALTRDPAPATHDPTPPTPPDLVDPL